MNTNGRLHPGIRLHSIPVSGAAGFLFVIGSTLIFLFGIPSIRWFFVASMALGLGLAVALPILHRYSSRKLARETERLKLT